jgi:predicted GIY-YIG superfamily endonuclease
MFTFYLCRCKANGKVYVGITCRSFETRKTEHIKCLETRDAYSKAWTDDWLSYGPDTFEWQILHRERCTGTDARRREREYILKYNAEDLTFGYNGGCVQHIRDCYVEPDASSFLSAKELRRVLREGLIMYHDYRPSGARIEPGGWLGKVVSVQRFLPESDDLTVAMEYLHSDGMTEEWLIELVANKLRCALTRTRVLARLATDEEIVRWSDLERIAKAANRRAPFPKQS